MFRHVFQTRVYDHKGQVASIPRLAPYMGTCQTLLLCLRLRPSRVCLAEKRG